MISKKLSKMLAAQVGNELAASQTYLGMAAYFGLLSLDKWAEFFYRQSAEERDHALKIVRFLVDVNEPFAIPAVAQSTTKYKAPLAVVKAALANEQQVTKQFSSMAQGALAEKDYTTFQFLQWFIEEQVEEEATMQKLVDLLASDINIFESQEHLPNEG